MKRWMLVVRFLAVILLLPAGMFLGVMSAAVPTWAATSQNVTVNATPAYVSISNSPANWTMDGLTGDGRIATDTVYYSNPLGDTTPPSATVVDGECLFTLTDSSTVNIDLTVNCDNFTGGDANMTNSDDGSNGATQFGGYSWYSGLTYASKVLMKHTGSTALKTGHSGNIKWGVEIETRTDVWTGSSTSQATLTITATAS